MSYKPDHYHQTNPPCELKSAVMGRENSRKKSEAKTEAKLPSGSLSGATSCSAALKEKMGWWSNFEDEENNALLNYHRMRRDNYENMANLTRDRKLSKMQTLRFRMLAARHNRRVIYLLQNVKFTRGDQTSDEMVKVSMLINSHKT